eukprot:TRINITY_DN30616_c0_g1_i1.p1 TRINITY_DN30616_c0_g1~~TRINITY_DN30616_c0_g1_i1.p1  ORF type:complete len:861 (-),score=160.62 TRINITY_DN30616_c0_g1_i1:61-2619(-)
MQNCTSVDESLKEQLALESPCFVGQLLPQVMELVRSSRRLPQGEEHAIRRGSRDFLNASKELGQRSLRAAHRVLQFLDPSLHQGRRAEELGNFNLIVDSIDSILEKVDSNIRDAAAGVSHEEEPEPADAAASSGSLSRASSFGQGRSGAKPQVRWRQLVDNHRTHFVPRLLVKHNQRVPLSQRLLAAQQKAGFRSGGNSVTAAEPPSALQSHLTAMGVGKRPEDMALPNPYEEELAELAWPDSFFQPVRAQQPGRMEDTPLVLVRTEQELRQMVQEIQATCLGKEIAVDVEHHDFRSYRGFVCLIQVSTRQKDFLIDPFDMFEQMHMLNEIFSDPRILKVLHGADRDVHWLQRDFSVYLVNMFDTGQATRALRLQGGFSLANLVSHLCGVKLDKKYQTADWRERPLPQEMLYYARADTHYLLYCYDCLRNALLAQTGMDSKISTNLGLAMFETGDLQPTDDGVALLQTVLDKSTALCRSQYQEAPLDSAGAAISLCERYGSKQRSLEPRQLAALQALIDWRDQLARRIDESLNFVAPDACLWRVCLAMPSTPMRLRSTCNPLPVILQQHAQEVVDIVQSGEARTTSTTEVLESPGRLGMAPVSASVGGAESGQANSMAAASSPSSATLAKIPKVSWPVRSPEASPRPLVHVTAVFGRGSPATLNGRVGTCRLLCPFAESDDEGAVPKPGKEAESLTQLSKATAISREFSFSAPAPVAGPQAATSAAAQSPASKPAAAGDVSGVLVDTPLAPAGAGTILRGARKKKRKRTPAGVENLERIATAEATVSPGAAPAQVVALVAAHVNVAPAPNAAADMAVAPQADANPQPKKKKKKIVKKRVVSSHQTPLVDPYL